MNISVFGLGYVGTVALGCLAQLGHHVVGVDISPTKVRFVNDGRSPIVEHGIEAILAEQRNLGRLCATEDGVRAARDTDISFICVGTPSTANGHLDLDGVFRVCRDIGLGIAQKPSFHTVVIRSTVLPGTNKLAAKVIADSSEKKQDVDFAVVSNPEFLREGSAVRDFFEPPVTLLGAASRQALDKMRELYAGIDARIVETDVGVVELTKYVSNTFHALKVVFANEVGSICKRLGIDARKVMQVFCMDTKLNLSPYYFSPGFAYGGSCLPKDLRALRTLAHDHYLECPVIDGIEKSNEALKDHVLNRIVELGRHRIGFLGLSFKPGTDDLRSSPIVDVLEKLLGRGFLIRIFDRNVCLSQLVGANRDFILQRIPLISQFVTDDVDEVIEFSDLLVVVNKDPEFPALLKRKRLETIVYDLVDVGVACETPESLYEGISW